MRGRATKRERERERDRERKTGRERGRQVVYCRLLVVPMSLHPISLNELVENVGGVTSPVLSGLDPVTKEGC